MAAIKIFLENNMVNFQQTGDKIPYGRNQVEPRYKDTTVSFYHEDLATLKFETVSTQQGLKLQEDFLFSEIQDDVGTPIGDKAAIQTYFSDKIGNF